MMMTFENTPLYQLREWHVAGVSPLNYLAHMGKALYRSPLFPMSYTHAGRHAAAASELIERVTRQYGKPQFGITQTEINGKTVAVHEEYVAQKTFCNLIHFVRDTKVQSPKLLIVAPMSGHHATLLRGTVEAMLPYADVYITDWLDARNIPLYEGRFDMEDHLSYTIEFMRQLAPDLHVMAVCQPSVSVFAAAAVMNAQNDPLSPRSITLIGGPIDTRVNPTEVCHMAKKHNLHWFESNLITRVPINHTGFMRRVYPGFMQLMSFLSLNLSRHIDSHLQFFDHLVQGDGESAEVHRKFYDEYLSVTDLPAEFYLQSVDIVFQRHLLPKGEMTYKGEIINPAAINKTSMLCLEGSLDDISGPGQTRVAMDLTKGLAASKKKYHLEDGVGHYGIFNGRKFRNNVLPIIVDFMKEQGK